MRGRPAGAGRLVGALLLGATACTAGETVSLRALVRPCRLGLQVRGATARTGALRVLEFRLRLGEPGTGRVRIEDNEPNRSGPPEWPSGRRDPDPANDEAVIRVLG